MCSCAIEENQGKINEVIATACSAKGALLDFVNEKAHKLKLERERLRLEQRQCKEALSPLQQSYDADELRQVLGQFSSLCEHATREELQRVLRLTVRRIAWMPNGEHKVQFYLPTNEDKGKARGLMSAHDVTEIKSPPTHQLAPQEPRTNGITEPLVRDFCVERCPAPSLSRTNRVENSLVRDFCVERYARPDSNQQPRHYECPALTLELRARNYS